MADEPLIPLFEAAWQSLDELGASLSDDDWLQPSELPGWTVKDVFAHLIGTESMLLGRTPPDVTESFGPHVKNQIGQANETWVLGFRAKSPDEVLREFREVTGERLAELRSLPAEGWDADSFTPRGPGRYRDFMEVRVFDTWMHEQDIRRSVGRPGHMDGPVVEQALNEIQRALPFIVGKKAETPQGSTVVFEVADTRIIAIGVEGRAGLLPGTPESPDVRVTADTEAFAAATGGRWDPVEALEAGRIEIEGDPVLGRKIVENLVFVV